MLIMRTHPTTSADQRPPDRGDDRATFNLPGQAPKFQDPAGRHADIGLVATIVSEDDKIA
jgi:hypothetical protein